MVLLQDGICQQSWAAESSCVQATAKGHQNVTHVVLLVVTLGVAVLGVVLLIAVLVLSLVVLQGTQHVSQCQLSELPMIALTG